ncbi:MAG: YkgJ family cysteine cluster protein [Vulcanimicrobiota bacterium]
MKISFEGKDYNVYFPPNFSAECSNCGFCCRLWKIQMDMDTYNQVKSLDIYEKMETENKCLIDVNTDNDTAIINLVENNCGFLSKDNLCLIHSEAGFEAKPLPCRQFPLNLFLTPEGIYVGFSHVCPSVGENKNQGFDEKKYIPLIEELIRKNKFKSLLAQNLPLAPGVDIDWQGYNLVENFLRSKLPEESTADLQLWEPLMILAFVVLNTQLPFINSHNLSTLIKKVDKTTLPEFNEIFRELFDGIAWTVLSIVESDEDEMKMPNYQALLNQSNFKSNTFDVDIPINELNRYMNLHEDIEVENRIRNYIKHLLWRKYLIEKGTILGNLGALEVVFRLCKWYIYAYAFTRKAPHPEISDIKQGIAVVERIIIHKKEYNILNLFTELITENILQQLMVIMNP